MSTARAQSTGIGDVFTDNLGTGAAVGAGAYVVSYVLTYVFVAIDGVQTSGMTDIAKWKQVGWVFYSAHFGVEIEASGAGMSQSFNVFDQLSQGSALTSTVPKLVYQIAPIVILLAAGYVAYQKIGLADASAESAAAAGASVVVGYFVLAIVGALVAFKWSMSAGGTTASVGPALATSALILGIAYPVVFGGIGGVLGNQ